MKVVVLGSGVIGVVSAYFLAKSGCEVVVIDKEVESGLGCSKANGGQLSYSHIQTWAHKESLKSLFKSSLLRRTCLSFKDFANPQFCRWFVDFYKNSPPEIALENSKKIHRINQLSRLVLDQILCEEKIEFSYKNKGILHFFYNQKDFDSETENLKEYDEILNKKYDFSDLFADAEALNPGLNYTKNLSSKSSLGHKFLSAQECVEFESSLIKLFDKNKLIGGFLYGADASGDSAKFTKNLAKICKEKYGVVFEYGNVVRNLLTNYKKITGINTDNGVHVADSYVFALGALSTNLLSGIGVETKIYPVKGYSLTIPCSQDFIAPNQAMTDQTGRVVYSRLENQFRVAGTAEIAGLSQKMNNRHLRFLRNNLNQNFSDFGNLDKAIEWQGFRPFRPNSIPLIGCVEKYGNLFVNVGHGSLGWTMACASGYLLSKFVNGSNFKQFSFLSDELKEISKA